MNLDSNTLRAISIIVICLVLLIQGVTFLGYIEANNWLYASIAVTGIVVIGGYVSQAIADQQFFDD